MPSLLKIIGFEMNVPVSLRVSPSASSRSSHQEKLKLKVELRPIPHLMFNFLLESLFDKEYLIYQWEARDYVEQSYLINSPRTSVDIAMHWNKRFFV